MTKLEYFEGDEDVAKDYSESKGCIASGSGYHCSCFDGNDAECCICGRMRPIPNEEGSIDGEEKYE
jgi:hypothetical protein